MITIVDYGIGNLGSIVNMLKRCGAPAAVSSKAEEIARAEKLILPGVGAFDNAVTTLREHGLVDALNRRVVEERTPILGICLGMQLMTLQSDEGQLPGLGWVKATTRRFSPGEQGLKVPHMGWNGVQVRRGDSIFAGLCSEARFYFVHSYYVSCGDEGNVLSTTRYGEDFCSSFQCGNIYGVQFHPEKSHKFGMRLLKNFAEVG